ncbi:fluoride efflux transporter FluC [Actinomadura sp. HBU206391]|uniref:fluoride efflux transporter FluC n=1 Tax=Actinomadura sp. HBU206391 TaxID=2731692 RepID=UPI00164FE137|nr:CrcB family protein [Actinomadura sp. HBU206391]MBC6457384.1 CrcB family protein [Actinomadura sp. HBU206391]
MPDPITPANTGRPRGPAGSPDGVSARESGGPRGPSRPTRRVPWATLAAVSAGGALGALARHGLSVALPAAPGSFAWATFLINVSGCLLIGALMFAITEVWQAPAPARPFLGVGVLGGFTTFSTYIVDVQRGVDSGSPGVAVAYLAGTVVTALAAVYAGDRVTRLIARRHRRPWISAGDGQAAAGHRVAERVHRDGGHGRER